MRTYLDCYACLLRQALEAARLAGATPGDQKRIVGRVLHVLEQIELTSSPPEIGDRVHRIVRELAGNGDPYRETKDDHTRHALSLYPRMKELVDRANDPLDTAARLSIAGNIIDAAPGKEYDVWGTVERVLSEPYAIDDMPAFRDAIAGAGRLLYLADNAGETVFDRVLIEALDLPATYAVKASPVLNDATREDALAAGLEDVATIVSTGSDAPGTIMSCCSPTFHELYENSDVIISKGQANYETLSDMGPQVFFLLQAKCPVIARDVRVPVGSIVLKQGG
jgi:uncharacterized protein with ATP-grasp and redox domains